MPDAAFQWLNSGAMSFALVGARVLALTATASIWSDWTVGWKLRLALVIALTILVGPLTTVELDAQSIGLEQIVNECSIGIALGLSTLFIILAARTAGDLIGVQAGLAPGQWLQGESQDSLGEGTPLGAIYGWIALMLYLAIDGPLTLIQALIDSFQIYPLGGGMNSQSIMSLTKDFGQALGLGLRLAAPALGAMILAGIAMGTLGRAAPGLSWLASTMPIRFLLALLMVLIGLATLADSLLSAIS